VHTDLTKPMPRNPYHAGPVTDHFDGTRFFVPGFASDKGSSDLFRFLSERGARKPWPKHVANPPRPGPVAEQIAGDALRVTFIGHATVLIQTQGLNLLVDPVFSKRASPVAFAGPSRVNDPGLSLDELPPLDAILVTHNHYDHLDLASLAHLAAHNPCPVLTPLGNDTIMQSHNRAIAAQGFDWGTRVSLSADVAVHFEACYHWSARGLRDRRMALWAAFVIETSSGKIYHIGDTGYSKGEIFRAMRVKHGPVRLAILPIGAYEPRSFMRNHHIDPEEAVAIFQDCGASYALAHHWGTFQLAYEAIDEPPKRLAIALERAGIPADHFQVKRPGEFFDVPLAD
jgi:L-ascorbate metabolism protein UlaG (beta-lactamase superfamily)